MVNKLANRVILITGDYGSGKSYLARELEKNLENSIFLSLATHLRLELSKRLEIPKEELFAKPTPTYIRDLLKGFGQYKLSIDPLYWINKLVDDFIDSGNYTLIIDDVRFFHEWEYFKRNFLSVELILLGDQYCSGYEIPKLGEVANYFFDEKPSVEEVLKELNRYW